MYQMHEIRISQDFFCSNKVAIYLLYFPYNFINYNIWQSI